MNNSGKKFKFDRMEFAGAIGDLGTLIPIFTALVAINGLNPTITLLLVGLLYITTGLYYNLPIPVQPLKAVAAIAIIGGMNSSVISASGILVGIILLFLTITNLTKFLSRIFSRPIIRGIQLGLGLLLIRTSLSLIINPIQRQSEINSFSISNLQIFNLVVILGGILIMLIFCPYKKFPTSILLLIFGIGISVFSAESKVGIIHPFVFQKYSVFIPSINDFKKAFLLLVIPQLPLTLSNAVVSTKDVLRRYFGNQAKKVTENSLCVSMGMANIFSGLVGGMPMCHGAGGLVAHYSFGSRTGGSNIIIGSICLILSLIFGKSVVEVIKLIPHSILGIMLFYVGFRHLLLINDIKEKKEIIIALGIGLIALFTQNLAIGYGLGIVFLYATKIVTKTSLPLRVHLRRAWQSLYSQYFL